MLLYICLYRSPSQVYKNLKSFCSSLNSLLSNINDQHHACSIVIEDLNAKCSKWCTIYKDNTEGHEIDSIATTAGHSQMINKPTHFINESSSCIDLIFSSNTSFIKNCRSELSIHEKCHRHNIYETLDFDIPPLHLIIETFGITNMQMLKISKKLFQRLTGLRLCPIEMKIKKCKILTDILLNV